MLWGLQTVSCAFILLSPHQRPWPVLEVAPCRKRQARVAHTTVPLAFSLSSSTTIACREFKSVPCSSYHHSDKLGWNR